MKKDITKLSILFFGLLIITIVVILCFGKTYNAKFKIVEDSGCNLKVENNSGELEILEEKKEDGNYLVKLKSIKPGKVSLILEHDDYQNLKIIYVHKNMVITENTFFGKSTYSEIIPISITIFLAYALYILINRLKAIEKENLYQYRCIAYLGIIIFLSFSLLNNLLSIYNYQGLYETIDNVLSSISIVSLILLPIAIITFSLVTISNINLIRKEGKSLKNLLGVFLGIFTCVVPFIPDLVYRYLMNAQIVDIYNLNSSGPYIYSFLETIIYLAITYLECILIATIIIAIKSIKKKVKYDKDYMIILGCQIRKDGSLTPLLKGRVDRALDFRNEQLELTGKDLIFVVSGGQGKDEIISEADAMKKYLVEQGVKENHILVENKSKNTFENIKFSNKLIEEQENDTDVKIGFSTTNYHVLRAGLIANQQGIKMEGIGSKTKAYFWINAFIREFIGTLYSEKKKHILFFLMIVLLIIFMVLVTYFANNL